MIMPNNQNILLKRSIYFIYFFFKLSFSTEFSALADDNFSKTLVDQKRRLMHKEIERRRRDKINDWIGFLSKQVPDCASDRTKQVFFIFRLVSMCFSNCFFTLGSV